MKTVKFKTLLFRMEFTFNGITYYKVDDTYAVSETGILVFEPEDDVQVAEE